MPMAPQRKVSTTASVRNCTTMSALRAQMDLLMPISRVRSETDTSMMFMIQMPQTTSDIDAMPTRNTLSVSVTLVMVASMSAELEIEKFALAESLILNLAR